MKYTLEEKIGQLFFVATYINASKNHIEYIEDLIVNHHIGGLTFFHSEASAAANYEGKKEVLYNENSVLELVKLINHYQALAEIPLLISIDAEWGLAMRIENTPQFPYAMTLGAIQDNKLIFEVGKKIGEHCKRVGIHINLAPVLDVNSNPQNPAIGYRSFGEDLNNVYEKSTAYLQGMQSAGILACGKHFPGHGDTDIDSHLALPIIRKDKKAFEEVELVTFKKAIEAELGSMMTGHIAVPKLTNDNNISASLSSTVTNDLLQKELGFEGLIMTDALNMHSVSKYFQTKGELEFEALKAGNDVLLFSENVVEAIIYIKNKIDNKAFSLDEIHQRLHKILDIKRRFCQNPFQEISDKNLTNDLFSKETEELQQELAKASLTLLKNKNSFLPLKKFERLEKTALLTIGNSRHSVFQEEVSKYTSITSFNISHEISPEKLEQLKNTIKPYETLIIGFFIPFMKPKDSFGVTSHTKAFFEEVLQEKNTILCFFGNPYAVNLFKNINQVQSMVLCYQDTSHLQKSTIEYIFGEFKAQGKLPVSIKKDILA